MVVKESEISVIYAVAFAVMFDRTTIPPSFNRLSIGKALFRATPAPRDRQSIVPTSGLIVAQQATALSVLIAAAITACPDLSSLTCMFLSSVGAPFLRPGLQSHRAPVATAVKGSAQPRGATRSRIFAESMASTGEHWTLRAVATSATLRQAGCIGTSASASRNPYGTSGSGSGKPSKSVTATPSIFVILLIAMYAANHDRGSLHFNLINPKTGNRIRMITQDSETEEELSRKDLVKGYEFKKDTYVVLTDEDFESARVESTGTMKVDKFVDIASVDPIYYDTSYYLAPDGKAGKDVYAVLRDAVANTGKMALARVVIARRERAVGIVPMGHGLVAHTLHEERDLNKAADVFDDIPAIR